MGYHRRQLLKLAQTNNSITNILEWQEKNPNFIVASSLNTKEGFIFMQSPSQRVRYPEVLWVQSKRMLWSHLLTVLVI